MSEKNLKNLEKNLKNSNREKYEKIDDPFQGLGAGPKFSRNRLRAKIFLARKKFFGQNFQKKIFLAKFFLAPKFPPPILTSESEHSQRWFEL